MRWQDFENAVLQSSPLQTVVFPSPVIASSIKWATTNPSSSEATTNPGSPEATNPGSPETAHSLQVPWTIADWNSYSNSSIASGKV